MPTKAKLNHKGFRELRESKAVQDDLLRRANKVNGQLPAGHTVSVGIAERDRRGRARATVKTETVDARVNARRNPSAYVRAAGTVGELGRAGSRKKGKK